MIFIRYLIALTPIVFFLSSCGYHIGAAQSRDEFVAQMKDGSFKALKNVETTTISRPFKVVVSDIQEYSAKCLNVSITTGPNLAFREVGGTMHYHSKIETNKEGITALVFQAEQGRESARHGAPPGGLYQLVAEIQENKPNATGINIYHVAGVGSVAEHLKLWAGGEKNRCPKL